MNLTRAKPLQHLSRLLKPAEKDTPYVSAIAFSGLFERTHLPVFRYIYGLMGGPRVSLIYFAGMYYGGRLEKAEMLAIAESMR